MTLLPLEKSLRLLSGKVTKCDNVYLFLASALQEVIDGIYTINLAPSRVSYALETRFRNMLDKSRESTPLANEAIARIFGKKPANVYVRNHGGRDATEEETTFTVTSSITSIEDEGGASET